MKRHFLNNKMQNNSPINGQTNASIDLKRFQNCSVFIKIMTVSKFEPRCMIYYSQLKLVFCFLFQMSEQPIVQHPFRDRPNKSFFQEKMIERNSLLLEDCQNLYKIWTNSYIMICDSRQTERSKGSLDV